MNLTAENILDIIMESCGYPPFNLPLLNDCYFCNRDQTIRLKMHTVETFTSDFTLWVSTERGSGAIRLSWHRAEETVTFKSGDPGSPAITNAIMRLKLGERLNPISNQDV